MCVCIYIYIYKQLEEIVSTNQIPQAYLMQPHGCHGKSHLQLSLVCEPQRVDLVQIL